MNTYGRRWAAEIVRRYNEEAPDGLGDRRRGNAGAKPLRGAEDEAALQAAAGRRYFARRREWRPALVATRRPQCGSRKAACLGSRSRKADGARVGLLLTGLTRYFPDAAAFS